MKINLKNRILLLGIASMLILLIIPQNILAIETVIDNEEQENYQDDPNNNIVKGEWKTNTFCRVKVWVYGACDSEPEFGIGFIREGYIWGDLGRYLVSGRNGTDVYKGSGELYLRFEYLFGFTLFKFDGWNSEAYVRGFAIKCKYIVK